MDIRKIYNKIDNIEENNHLKAGLYYSVIQIKKDNPSIKNEINSIYLDAKRFIFCYINSVEERDLGYDVVDTKKISKCIEALDNAQEQLQLSLNAYRLLKTKGFEDEGKEIRKLSNKKKTDVIRNQKYKFGKYFKLLLHLSSYSLSSIVLTICIIILISYVILLPAPFDEWVTYKVNYHIYSDSFYINHLVNILSNIFGIKNDFTIETFGLLGVFTLMTLKLFYLVFIVNYLYKKVIDIINN